MPSSRTRDLLSLAHELGRPDGRQAILGEGNVSTRDGATLWVKASGSRLATLAEADLVQCHSAPILALFDHPAPDDAVVDAALLGARVDARGKKPSMETLFHAALLQLPGVEFVGHTHPIATTQILCSPRAREFATAAMFPDQIVCCGEQAALVPYADPGVPLAAAIRAAIDPAAPPRVILLENHGAIALGRTPNAVSAALAMLEKAAEIFVGAAALGGPRSLTPAAAQRIASRDDEAHRRRMLNL